MVCFGGAKPRTIASFLDFSVYGLYHFQSLLMNFVTITLIFSLMKTSSCLMVIMFFLIFTHDLPTVSISLRLFQDMYVQLSYLTLAY